MDSIWLQTAQLPPFPPLRSDLKTDVLIIGGGMAGLLCAYKLSQAGVDCALVEANRIGSGVTRNTTAKITAQHGLIYASLLQRLGSQRAKLYLSANQAALAEYRALCRDIDCDFEERDAFVYSVDSGKRLEQELAALDRLGFAAEFVESLPSPSPRRAPSNSRARPSSTPQIHGRHCQGTADLRAYQGLGVGPRLGLHQRRKDLGGQDHRRHPLPAAEQARLLFPQAVPAPLLCAGPKDAPDVHGMYLDEDQTGLSFRNCGEHLLIGGGSHRTGKRGGGWSELERFTRRHYPKAQETARWATQDCMTLDGVPYVGLYSRGTAGLYVAAGFNKWGMTSSLVAAGLLTDLILGRDNPYTPVFSPSRGFSAPSWRQTF